MRITGIVYYKAQSKFVNRNHPFGDDAQFLTGLPSLEDILHANDGFAEGAFDELVRHGVDRQEIYHFLRMIGVFVGRTHRVAAKKA